MKKSLHYLNMFLAGITLAGITIYTNTSFAGDGKPEGKPWPCPDKEAKVKSPIKSDASVMTTGKELWNQHCKSCHGKTGKGDGTKAESINISCGDFTSEKYQKRTDGELYWLTTEGRKPMPSYKEKLTDNERWMIVLFTRTFK